MTMSEWAKREVEIACKKENPDWDGESFDYGCACYQSALKAFLSVCEDGHSGYSYALTKRILERLLNEVPLIPITDEDFFIENDFPLNSEEYLKERGLKSELQCGRKSSLFRRETLDGKVTYHDNARVLGVDITTSICYGNGMVDEIIDERFPITMPYFPNTKKYRVYTDDFLLDPKNGDLDHRAFLYGVTPDNEKFPINKYYKEVDGDWVEISLEEYNKDRELSFLEEPLKVDNN